MVCKGRGALDEIEELHFIQVFQGNSEARSRRIIVIFWMDSDLSPRRVKSPTGIV
jgi:hypothetical protein